jgi:mRNA-degrading endonuclease HigB of HigAB toxin-antitoxin module
MQLIANELLIEFWTKVPASRSALQAWHAEAKSASWATPTDVKAKYPELELRDDPFPIELKAQQVDKPF